MKFCCDAMSHILTVSTDVLYFPNSRSFRARIKTPEGTQVELIYCPWCGRKLPQDLDEKWIEVLKKEYGLNDPLFEDADKVPPEFETDEWWKKRRL